MENNTKIVIGLAAVAAAGVVAYLVLRPKNKPDGQLCYYSDIEAEFVKTMGRPSKNGDVYKFYGRIDNDNIPMWVS